MPPADADDTLPYPDVPFHEPSREEWRERVERELGDVPFSSLTSRTAEGLEIAPLYGAEDLPGGTASPPSPRVGTTESRAWRIAFEVRRWPGTSLAPEVAAGAELLWLVFGSDGLPPRTMDHLGTLLDGVDLATTAIQLDTGAEATRAKGVLVAQAKATGVAPDRLKGGLGADPLAALARDGEIPGELDDAWAEVADLAAWCRDSAPGVRAALVSASPVHEAGGGAVDELAWLVGGGVETLRHLLSSGFGVDSATAQVRFALSVGADLFLAIAKLRAARLLWARTVAAAGGDETAQAMDLHVRVASTSQTVRDPWGNLLRGTGEAFAAAVGGAASVAVAPFDEAAGRVRASSRRLAINTQHVLAEEAHLGDVVDPAGGSYYLEALTDSLARAAWSRFQAIEAAGGLSAAVVAGELAESIAASAERRRHAVATRRAPIVGVSEFPPREERPLDGDAPELPPGDVDPLARGDGKTTAPALVAWRRSAAFEALRDRVEAAGHRPKVFVATVGGPAETRVRVSWIENLLATTGVEIATCAPCETAAEASAAYMDTGADAAVIVSSDGRYPELVGVLAPELAERGGPIYLAGRPGEHEETYRRAGVDGFFFAGDDAVARLGSLLDALLPEEGEA